MVRCTVFNKLFLMTCAAWQKLWNRTPLSEFIRKGKDFIYSHSSITTLYVLQWWRPPSRLWYNVDDLPKAIIRDLALDRIQIPRLQPLDHWPITYQSTEKRTLLNIIRLISNPLFLTSARTHNSIGRYRKPWWRPIPFHTKWRPYRWSPGSLARRRCTWPWSV